MKKWAVLLIVLVTLVMSMQFAWADNTLTEKEQMIYDVLLDVIEDDFYEPSAVRILEIKDFMTYTIPRGDYAVIRLQGENLLGGTLNHTYIICLKSAPADATSDSKRADELSSAKNTISVAKTNPKLVKESSLYFAYCSLIELEGQRGDYYDMGDIEYESANCKNNKDEHKTMAKNINKALKSYWNDMGF